MLVSFRQITLNLKRQLLGHEVEVPVPVQQDSVRFDGYCSYDQISGRYGNASTPQLTAHPRGFLPSIIFNWTLIQS